jgi:hypothetical protein
MSIGNILNNMLFSTAQFTNVLVQIFNINLTIIATLYNKLHLPILT